MTDQAHRVYAPPASMNDAHVAGMPAYEALVAEAEADNAGYWARLARELISWKTPFTQTLDDSNAPFFKWFADGTLNASYNCLDRNVERGLGGKTAIIFEADDGAVTRITYAELHRAKALLGLAMAELDFAGVAVNYDMEAGIMIEVPSAVQVADQLAEIADFFSIGTNDLTQYLMAADRGNPKVADLANALQPAVLRAIKQTVDVGHAHGIWVGMCGELAGNPLATPVLVGLGLDELSMSAPAIPQVKQVIRQLDTRLARQIADTVLKLDSADRITYYLNNQVARDHLPQ